MHFRTLGGTAVLAAALTMGFAVAQDGVSGNLSQSPGIGRAPAPSPTAACPSSNMTCATGWSGGNTNWFATPFTTTSAEIATGARLRTSVAGTFDVELWNTDATGKPTTLLSGTGTITVGATYGTYSGNFPSPVPLAPGNYALVHRRMTGSSNHPACPGGSTYTHYWHPPTSTTWNGPFNSVQWAFEVICGTSCSPATFTTYGAGCAGSGKCSSPGGCCAFNMTCTTGYTVGNTNTFAQPCALKAGTVVTGMTLRNSSSAGGSAAIELRAADTAGKPGALLASGTIAIGTTYGDHSGSFGTPYTVTTAGTYFMVHTLTNANHPICTTGTNVLHYWHPPSSTTWNGPFTTAAWSLRLDCRTGSSNIPVLSATGLPQLGGSFSIDLTCARPTSPAALLIGTSNPNLALGFIGRPDCTLLSSGDVVLGLATDANGDASVTLRVANNKAWCGVKLYTEWGILDVGATSNIAASNGGLATIGT